MKTVVTVAIIAAAFAVSASAATPIYWTKAGAVAAVKAGRVWRVSPPLTGSQSPLRVTAVSRATPSGKIRTVAGKVTSARWDMTVTLSHYVPETVISPSKTVAAHTVVTQERFCVAALSPVKGSATVFRIDGWAFNSTNGGCARAGLFDQGGSATYRP